MKGYNSGDHAGHQSAGDMAPYWKLAAMAFLSFLAMYALMYAMVDSLSNVRPNHNQAFMAGLMTGPMVLFELALMRMMYPNAKVNLGIALVATALLVGCFVAIRRQTAIGDEQFLKSMIPHHAAAILMCREAAIEDAQIRDLCRRITSGQQAEIEEMNAKLEELEGG